MRMRRTVLILRNKIPAIFIIWKSICYVALVVQRERRCNARVPSAQISPGSRETRKQPVTVREWMLWLSNCCHCLTAGRGSATRSVNRLLHPAVFPVQSGGSAGAPLPGIK
ncbi:hypothetical protein CURTO8I2_180056 [Curtobacterium sp. 8I-2]|nr:hypothetical protein CURTO8I2_180056 [Curtobacterium sp. 8I-2]